MKLKSSSLAFGPGLINGFVLPAIFLSLLIFFACNNGGSGMSNDEMQTSTQELPDGFEDFYKKFHRDSTFQMEHITFPLQGIPDFADSLRMNSPYYWNRAEWLMHRELDMEEGNYIRSFKSNNYIVEEVIRDENNFGTVRRFYLVDGDWNLIYYSGMNLMKR